jgi:hypothetical protein
VIVRAEIPVPPVAPPAPVSPPPVHEPEIAAPVTGVGPEEVVTPPPEVPPAPLPPLDDTPAPSQQAPPDTRAYTIITPEELAAKDARIAELTKAVGDLERIRSELETLKARQAKPKLPWVERIRVRFRGR